MKTSLSDLHRALADERMTCRGFGGISEHAHQLIRKDPDRLQLHKLLITGANFRQSGPADVTYFATLRERIKSCTHT